MLSVVPVKTWQFSKQILKTLVHIMKHYLELVDIKAEYSMITEISHCERTDYLKWKMTAAEKMNMSTFHIHFQSVLSKQRVVLFAVSGKDLVFENSH